MIVLFQLPIVFLQMPVLFLQPSLLIFQLSNGLQSLKGDLLRLGQLFLIFPQGGQTLQCQILRIGKRFRQLVYTVV